LNGIMFRKHRHHLKIFIASMFNTKKTVGKLVFLEFVYSLKPTTCLLVFCCILSLILFVIVFLLFHY